MTLVNPEMESLPSNVALVPRPTIVLSERTDTLMLCQGERAILETTFRYPGDFMFHAHQSEFAELGWMGLFRAEADGDS